jgi:hypothetical protein
MKFCGALVGRYSATLRSLSRSSISGLFRAATEVGGDDIMRAQITPIMASQPVIRQRIYGCHSNLHPCVPEICLQGGGVETLKYAGGDMILVPLSTF